MRIVRKREIRHRINANLIEKAEPAKTGFAFVLKYGEKG